MSRRALSSLTSRLELAIRTLSGRSSILWKQSSSATGDGDKDKDKQNNGSITDKSSEEPYDPKKDNFFTQETAFGSKDNKGLGNPERPVFSPEVEGQGGPAVLLTEEALEAPTNCCGSGCPNCVWIDYVEKLSKKFEDPSLGREKILEALDEIDDQNIKAYIMMELRVKKLI